MDRLSVAARDYVSDSTDRRVAISLAAIAIWLVCGHAAAATGLSDVIQNVRAAEAEGQHLMLLTATPHNTNAPILFLIARCGALTALLGPWTECGGP